MKSGSSNGCRWLISLLTIAALASAWLRAAETVKELDAQPIELTDFYGKVAGTEGDSWFTHDDWEKVPKGLQNFGGIVFDVSGTMLLSSKKMPQLKERHSGIPVKGKHRYVHILHGVGYADPSAGL